MITHNESRLKKSCWNGDNFSFSRAVDRKDIINCQESEIEKKKQLEATVVKRQPLNELKRKTVLNRWLK